jgi:hypothetical protein
LVFKKHRSVHLTGKGYGFDGSKFLRANLAHLPKNHRQVMKPLVRFLFRKERLRISGGIGQRPFDNLISILAKENAFQVRSPYIDGQNKTFPCSSFIPRAFLPISGNAGSAPGFFPSLREGYH